MSAREANLIDGTTETLGSKYEFEWPKAYWIGTAVFFMTVVPAWAFLGTMLFPGRVVGTASGCVLIVGLLVSSYTDARWRLIPNWVTYSTILFGLALNTFETSTHFRWSQLLGGVGIADSLTGFIVLFIGLLVIFSFSGGGAGDVKLVGAIGAMLGFARGLEAVCVSFVICAILTLSWEMIRRLRKNSGSRSAMPNGKLSEGSRPEETIMGIQIPLAPSFAVGTFVVLFRDAMIEQPEMFQFWV